MSSEEKRPFRVLDYGCGNGKLVAELTQVCEPYGVEAYFKTDKSPEEIVYKKEMLGKTIFGLRGTKIPFKDAYFDFIYSNQVFEHVENLDPVLSEISRVLKPGGKVLHLFPIKATIREGHTGVPFMHWFKKNSPMQFSYSKFMHKIGFGYHRKNFTNSFDWATERSRYLTEQTFYRDEEEIKQLLRKYKISYSSAASEWLRFRIRRKIGKNLSYLPFAKIFVKRFAGLVVFGVLR